MLRAYIYGICGFVLLPCAACEKAPPLNRLDQERQITALAFSPEPLLRKLAIAVDKADIHEITSAIEAGADVNAFGSDGYRILDWAMARGNVRGFECLLEKGASVGVVFKDPRTLPDRSYNHTILERVLGKDSKDFIRAVLRTGISPDHVLFSVDERSLIFFAVQSKAVNVVDTLLDEGASIDHRDSGGRTSLFTSLLARDYVMAWHLLQRGADPTAANNHGHDFIWGLKEWGSRGVKPAHRESFEAIVTELVARGLLTRQDIVEADKPKPSVTGRAPGITVIEHTPQSEAGQALRKLDAAEREANQRTGR